MRARLLAEALGSGLLLATVVGSGIMAVRLSGGNDGVALLANAAATAGMLYVLIQVLGPVSGAHFNPVVTMVAALDQRMPMRMAGFYMLAQVLGAVAGVLLAHAMFDLPLVQMGTHERAGLAQCLSEAVATFGLVLTIALAAKHRPTAIALLVASYVFAAYWFTASTSFANPAVTLARSLTDSFAGIRPRDVAAFCASQVVGALLAMAAARLMGDVACKGEVDS